MNEVIVGVAPFNAANFIDGRMQQKFKANASANLISIGGARFQNHVLFEVSFVRTWLFAVALLQLCLLTWVEVTPWHWVLALDTHTY